MLVVFISECRGFSIKKTRTVLDNFARRAGGNVWITNITLDSLKSVKKELSKKASKNTAVICWRVVGRKKLEKLWVVGRKDMFNEEGFVATNYTYKDKIQKENSFFKNIEAIKILVSLSALFHDTGKMWIEFQKVVKNNSKKDLSKYNIRHEFVSLALFASFVNGRKVEDWLSYLVNSNIEIDNTVFKDIIEDRNPYIANDFDFKKCKFLNDSLSKAIGWLLITHHIMDNNPSLPGSVDDFQLYLQAYDSYYKNNNAEVFFDSYLWDESKEWIKKTKKSAKKALNFVLQNNLDTNSLSNIFEDRLTLILSRLSLVIGDWQYSQYNETQWQSEGFMLAKSGDKPQYLDEHLIGVYHKSLEVVHHLFKIYDELNRTEKNKKLRAKSPEKFSWQDKVANHISAKYDNSYGFFCLNQAGTGAGKTFCNAKIMNSVQNGNLRYSLLMGLRSLTLQTGDEYLDKVGFGGDEVSVVIGEKTMQDLHELKAKEFENIRYDEIEKDWDSMFVSQYVNDEPDTCFWGEDALNSVLKNNKSKKILYSPILIATIDHLVGSTEDVDKGRFILPMLRLFSSDLVIDEIDDFDGNDMHAVLRMVHMAGMFGRNVVLSSATIPPEDAIALYESYKNGRREFCKNIEENHGKKADVFCVWCDDHNIHSKKIGNDFEKEHEFFINKRIETLQIISSKKLKHKYKVVENEIDNTFDLIVSNIKDLHKNNNYCGSSFGETKVSFGVVRLANIYSVANLSLGLLNYENDEDTAFVVMPYHSRFPIIQRHEIEKELDLNLKRNKYTHIERKYLSIRAQEIIKNKEKEGKKNIIFIVVASPVEEVGRDHDFDWGIIEPSSIRSIIQMIGRILRHRSIQPDSPNIVFLNKNIKYLINKKNSKDLVFYRPGYESKYYEVKDKTFNGCVENSFNGVLSSIPRISFPDKKYYKDNHFSSLAMLEHAVLYNEVVKQEDENPFGWSNGKYFLNKSHQKEKMFRKKNSNFNIFIYKDINDPIDKKTRFYCFDKTKNSRKKKNQNNKSAEYNIFIINDDINIENLWLDKSYFDILNDHLKEDQSLDKLIFDKKYGQVSVPVYYIESADRKHFFSPWLGIWDNKEGLEFLRNKEGE